MKNAQNITIVLLMMTAIALGAILVSSYASGTAYAGEIKGGGYLMSSLSVSNSTDVVCIIDTTTRRMNTYFARITASEPTPSIDPVGDTIDLDNVFSD